MSKVKIIKDRQTSSMADAWFSSLTILATQHDLLDELATDDIIDSFAQCSLPLQKLLISD